MGLLSALGKRGLRSLRSGEMFGARMGAPSRVTEADEKLMGLLMQNPQATDQEIAQLLFGPSIRSGMIDEDVIPALVQRYRARNAYHNGPNPTTWGT